MHCNCYYLKAELFIFCTACIIIALSIHLINIGKTHYNYTSVDTDVEHDRRIKFVYNCGYHT